LQSDFQDLDATAITAFGLNVTGLGGGATASSAPRRADSINGAAGADTISLDVAAGDDTLTVARAARDLLLLTGIAEAPSDIDLARPTRPPTSRASTACSRTSSTVDASGWAQWCQRRRQTGSTTG